MTGSVVVRPAHVVVLFAHNVKCGKQRIAAWTVRLPRARGYSYYPARDKSVRAPFQRAMADADELARFHKLSVRVRG